MTQPGAPTETAVLEQFVADARYVPGRHPCAPTWRAIATLTRATATRCGICRSGVAATKSAADGPAKQVGGFHHDVTWLDWLAALGQVNELGALLREARSRTPGDGRLQENAGFCRCGGVYVLLAFYSSFQCQRPLPAIFIGTNYPGDCNVNAVRPGRRPTRRDFVRVSGEPLWRRVID